MEDAYYEEEMGVAVNNMLSEAHMLDASDGGWNSIASIGGQDIFQDDFEIHRQFSSGIKALHAIAVISVESQGLVQFGSTQKLPADGPPDNRSIDFVNYDKLSALEERFRVVESNDCFDPLRAAEVCLVPNIIVPKNFRILEFIKYTGLECPNTHLRSYCNKMVEVIYDDRMLIYFFQESLTGSALSWYMRLDNIKIKTWKNLVDAFLKQYKFNLEIASDRTILMVMEKENQESMRAYA
ncbi:hypothetical protein NC651_012148 [Populus alba x Populus x berolinensis]|nr:hypothetical protein NC651_012148 [Populus alba x Populus x berolinensis]